MSVRLRLMLFPLVLLALSPVFGQSADSDQLRALLKTVPQLPVERIYITANPPLMFEGISALAADQRGNIYGGFAVR